MTHRHPSRPEIDPDERLDIYQLVLDTRDACARVETHYEQLDQTIGELGADVRKALRGAARCEECPGPQAIAQIQGHLDEQARSEPHRIQRWLIAAMVLGTLTSLGLGVYAVERTARAQPAETHARP